MRNACQQFLAFPRDENVELGPDHDILCVFNDHDLAVSYEGAITTGRLEGDGEVNLNAWKQLLASGAVECVHARAWCGIMQLHAYSRNQATRWVDAINHSPEAYQAVRDAGITIE